MYVNEIVKYVNNRCVKYVNNGCVNYANGDAGDVYVLGMLGNICVYVIL